jgi:4,5-dihydroxyphthalate decarboxylase
MVAVRRELMRERPDIVRELYALLQQSKDLAPAATAAANATATPFDLTPFGLEANRGALERLLSYAHVQDLIPQACSVEELFEDFNQAMTS